MTQSTANGKASTTKETFSRATTISIDIKADPAIIWELLTNASDIPRWNSTVTALEGKIALGETVQLKSILDEKRTFKLKVKEFEPKTRFVWGDRQGQREYKLTPAGDKTTTFTMTEKIGGLMFPLYAKYIPPFDESFEQYAADLKKEAESTQSQKG